jgi:glucokinase
LATESLITGSPHPPTVIAIDVGGTSIKAALVTADAALHCAQHTPTPRGGEAALVRAIARAARDVALDGETRGLRCSGVGVAAAGIIDEANGVARRGANLHWRNTALADRLQAELEMPVQLLQDARASALGEAIFGAGRDAESFLTIVLGTGVGGALVVESRPVRGAHGLAGEIGHLQVDPQGLPCGCGGRGCVETLASASALSRRFAAATGERLRAEDVVTRALGGDGVARRLWDEAIGALAAALAASVTVLDCALVVIGGGMAAVGAPLLDQLGIELRRRLNLVPPPELRLAVLGSASGLLGAAAAALDRLGRDDVIREWRSAAPPDVGSWSGSGSARERRAKT